METHQSRVSTAKRVRAFVHKIEKQTYSEMGSMIVKTTLGKVGSSDAILRFL